MAISSRRPTGLKVVVVLSGVQGVLSVLAGVLVLLLAIAGSSFAGVFGSIGGDLALAVVGIVGAALFAFGTIFLLLGIVRLFAAWGLWRLAAWARLLESTLAVLSLFSPPLGSLMAVAELYCLWVDPATRRLFD